MTKTRQNGDFMLICNSCEWSGREIDGVMCGDVGPLCPECNETTYVGHPHDMDDDAICVCCGLDVGEASYYAKRGYAHEYPTLNDCPGRK